MSVHGLEIVQRFWADGYTCECACGWTSDEMATQNAALEKGRVHLFDAEFVPACDTEGS